MSSHISLKSKSPGTNLYIPHEIRAHLEKSVITLSSDIGRQITASSFVRYLIHNYSSVAIMDIKREAAADQRS